MMINIKSLTKESDKVSVLGTPMKPSTLIIKKTMAMSLLLVSSVYAMELSIEYDNDNQKSFKAQLMAGKIDECFKHIEGQKEKNRHYWTLAHEALFCINRPESSLNILKRIEALLHDSPNSCELIHLAAQYNDVELLKYLKGNHTVVDLKDGGGATPLFYAAYGNALETMKLLKDCGANINAKNRFDETPFHGAVLSNAIEAMELLKEWGADINAKNRLDATPFHFAVQANSIEAMKLLMHWFADIHAKTRCGETALHYAAQANAIEAMKLLKDLGWSWSPGINAKNDRGETPLHYAAQANAVEAMKLLKDWGAHINANDSVRQTPLDYAAQANAIEAMELLKEWGADINAKNYYIEETPLHFAAKRNAIKAMQLLIHWGAEINAENCAKKTALYYAVESNAIEAMKLLYEWAADINAKNYRGETPLHCAAKVNAIEAMKLLKHWGTDINAKTSAEKTPLNYAAEGNAIEAMKLLKDWGAHINTNDTLLHCAAQANAIEAMKLLKDWGADINAKNDHGETPLHFSVQTNSIEAMKLLKDWGANIEEKEMNGNTALDKASSYDKKESMDFLYFLGANSNLVNPNYGHSGWKCFEFISKINQMKPTQSLDANDVFELLREAVQKGLFCSVRKLLSLGKIKDVNQKTDTGYTFFDRGFTILHEAVDKNKIYVVKILLTTPEINPYSRTYGTLEKCDTCKAQTHSDKILKTHPRGGCQTCGSLTPYDLASPEIKEIYHEMRARIAIICCLKKLGLPKELAYILFRLSNYAAKHTFLPKGLFHKALKVQGKKHEAGQERLKIEANLAQQQKEAEDEAKQEKRLKLEAEKNEKNKEFMEAALFGNTVNDKTIKELQKNSLNEQNAAFKRTPAMTAAILGNLELLKQLVSLDADLLAQNSVGHNALHLAVLHDRADIAQYIMQCEPRTAIAKNKDGLNPIDLAIKLKKSKELLQALYEETKKVTISNQQKTNKTT